VVIVDQDRARVIAAMSACAEACNRTFSDDTLKAFAHLLRDLPLAAVLRQFTLAMGDGRFPSMNSVRAAVLGSVDDRDEAQDIADRILAAIPRFGGYRATDARTHLGEAAWEVVARFGGWEQVCKVTDRELGTLRAQMRDCARAVLAKARAGALGAATALPNPVLDRRGLAPAAGLLASVLPPRGA
jgi:hypothetical protein